MPIAVAHDVVKLAKHSAEMNAPCTCQGDIMEAHLPGSGGRTSERGVCVGAHKLPAEFYNLAYDTARIRVEHEQRSSFVPTQDTFGCRQIGDLTKRKIVREHILQNERMWR